jgi:hypothetical protein
MQSFLVIKQRERGMAIKRLPAWFYGAIALVPMSILLLAFPVLDRLSRIGLLISAVVWGVIFVAMSWRRMDEAARAANKVAWMHGGGAALILAVLLVPAVRFLPAAGDLVDSITASWSPGWPAAKGGFALGVMTTIMLQAAGAMIAWAGWWLRRR